MRCCGLAWTHTRRCCDEVLWPRSDERHCVLAWMVVRHHGLPRTATRYCVLAWVVTRHRCCDSRKHWFVSFLKEKEIFVSSFKEKEISFSSLKENASSYLLRGEGAVPPPSPSRRRRCLFLSPSRIEDKEISPPLRGEIYFRPFLRISSRRRRRRFLSTPAC